MKKLLFTSLSMTLILIGILILGGCTTNNGTKDDVEYEISNISFNGIKIGDKIQEKMKNLVMDTSFLYSYKEIGINVDENDTINYLKFNTLVDEMTVKDANIKYKNNKLSTLSDFEKYFGEGEKSYFDNNDKNYRLTYEEVPYVLTLDIINGELYNLCLEKKI